MSESKNMNDTTEQPKKEDELQSLEDTLESMNASTEEDKEEDIVEKDDVTDMLPEIPNNDQLQKLLQKISNMSPSDKKNLLANIAGQNAINPGNNYFNNASPKEMMREKLRRKMKDLKGTRNSKKAIQFKTQKKNDAINKVKQEQEAVAQPDEGVVEAVEQLAEGVIKEVHHSDECNHDGCCSTPVEKESE